MEIKTCEKCDDVVDPQQDSGIIWGGASSTKNKFKLDKFIVGELVDLCIPTSEYAKESDWYSWFNNPKTTRFLEQGIFPNTNDDELIFFEKEKDKRLILIVCDKSGDDLGVISFSFINYAKRTADLAMVLNEKYRHPLCALESMALMVEHGFTLLGLQRIHIGQHIKLKKWQSFCELLGFKLEGIYEKGFIKGRERSDSMVCSVLLEDYDILVKNRNGHLWDGSDMMLKRIKNLPKEQFVNKLSNFFDTARKEYYDEIFSL